MFLLGNQHTLTEIIREHARPESIIVIDCWGGYCRVKYFYEHYTVNHSKNYSDPNNRATTNTIEGAWNGIKH